MPTRRFAGVADTEPTMPEFLSLEFLGQPTWLWAMFIAIVLALLTFDLGVLHRDQHEIDVRESLMLSAGYMAIACVFGAWVWWYLGGDSGLEFFTGYLVEWSLSLDNIFVISLIFTYFAVPRKYQHRVLFWGILGVIVFRAILIGVGAALVTNFSWILYLFGAFLVFTGVKMLVASGHGMKIEDNALIGFLRRHLNVTDTLHGDRFWVRLPHPTDPKRNIWWATPLFLCLMLVEIVDLVFAVDSVPAIFAITTDPFIVYTSNIFAILGLRALYFALAAMVDRFAYLKTALALILLFIGAKIVVADTLELVHLPPWVSLVVTLVLLTLGVVYSLWRTRRATEPENQKTPAEIAHRT
jgi:tellurite resistance protein TerC